jgi:hypothetical protein
VSETAEIKYAGDRPFMMVTVEGVGRVLFNRHNNFTQELPTGACIYIMRQWGKFFEIKRNGGSALPSKTDTVGPFSKQKSSKEVRRLTAMRASERKRVTNERAAERRREVEAEKAARKGH